VKWGIPNPIRQVTLLISHILSFSHILFPFPFLISHCIIYHYTFTRTCEDKASFSQYLCRDCQLPMNSASTHNWLPSSQIFIIFAITCVALHIAFTCHKPPNTSSGKSNGITSPKVNSTCHIPPARSQPMNKVLASILTSSVLPAMKINCHQVVFQFDSITAFEMYHQPYLRMHLLSSLDTAWTCTPMFTQLYTLCILPILLHYCIQVHLQAYSIMLCYIVSLLAWLCQCSTSGCFFNHHLHEHLQLVSYTISYLFRQILWRWIAT